MLFHDAAPLVSESAVQPTAMAALQTLTLFLLVQQHPATWHMYKTRAAPRAAVFVEQMPNLYLAVTTSLATMPPLRAVAMNLLATARA